jgi:hypothetical protein
MTMIPLLAHRTYRLMYILSAVAAKTALRFCSLSLDAFSMKFSIVCLVVAVQNFAPDLVDGAAPGNEVP